MRLRLLERIRQNRGTGPGLTGAEALVASLEKHLNLILNTHQGSSASAPDYGLPDMASLVGDSENENFNKMAKILTEVIAKYEPRLKNAVAQRAPFRQTGILEFTVSGLIELDNEDRDLLFSTAIRPDGQIQVT
ncbi:MAG: type VI secretion system baseplate subunit TssE [Deltaproteobacteria bacterium]|jgi:type VI secretion system lysozyme-like protein|nr:type VI secretion system baseplate subunit TssE [Deltaproteobacteria bacterium]